jgi:hypothetical protein
MILPAVPMISRKSGELNFPKGGGFETRPYNPHDLTQMINAALLKQRQL